MRKKNYKGRVVKRYGSYYRIISQYTGTCVDMDGGNLNDYHNVHTWTYGMDNNNQRWSFTPYKTPSITTSSLSDGKVNTSYKATIAATGSGELIWSIQSGSLPSGLSINKGIISGTPNKAGTFTFVIKVSDMAGGVYTKQFTIKINTDIVAVTGVKIADKNGTVWSGRSSHLLKGRTYTFYSVVTPSDATNKNVTWSSSNNNVATVTSEGVVIAKAEGTVDISVKTADGGKTAVCKFTVVTPPTIKTSSLNDGEFDKEYFAQLTADGTAPITWSVIDGALPNGLKLESSSGYITGTPKYEAFSSEITYRFTIQAKNAGGATTKSLSIKIKEASKEFIHVTGVRFTNEKIIKLEKGKHKKLSWEIIPSNADSKSYVEFYSSDESVAETSGGYVTAVSVGVATITIVTEDGGYIDTCTVEVIESNNDDIITGKSTTIVAGQKINLKDTCFSDVTETNIRFVVDDKSKAGISKDMLTAKNKGTVKVTAQKQTGKNQYENVSECTITILGKPQLKFTKSMTYVGQTVNANDFFQTEDLKLFGATYWESAKPGVVEVTDAGKGTLKAKGTGSAKITAYFGERGKKGTLKVSATIAVKKPDFQKKEYTLQTGGKLTLAMKNVTAASNPDWVTERSGIISATPQTDKKGNKTGKVIIEGLAYGDTKLIATIDGQEYECTVHVAKPSINKATMELKVGKTGTLTLKNTKIKKQDIVWTSEDSSIATVDSAGKVKAVSAGSTIIYTEAGGYRNECIVTVK